jgi:hypothetical protein
LFIPHLGQGLVQFEPSALQAARVFVAIKVPGQLTAGHKWTILGPVKTHYFKIRADSTLALVVAEAMEKTGLGQSDILRLGSLRGVPEISSALMGGTAVTRLPEKELRRRIEALRFRTRLSPGESATLRRKGRK